MYGYVLAVAKGEEILAKLSISHHVIHCFFQNESNKLSSGKNIKKKLKNHLHRALVVFFIINILQMRYDKKNQNVYHIEFYHILAP